MDPPTSISTAEVLEDLEAAEQVWAAALPFTDRTNQLGLSPSSQSILQLLDLAKQTCDELGNTPFSNAATLQTLGTEFVSLVPTIDEKIRRHAHVIAEQERPPASDYALRTEVNISQAAKTVSSVLNTSNILK